jgi:hypothetical protein
VFLEQKQPPNKISRSCDLLMAKYYVPLHFCRYLDALQLVFSLFFVQNLCTGQLLYSHNALYHNRHSTGQLLYSHNAMYHKLLQCILGELIVVCILNAKYVIYVQSIAYNPTMQQENGKYFGQFLC